MDICPPVAQLAVPLVAWLVRAWVPGLMTSMTFMAHTPLSMSWAMWGSRVTIP